VPVITTDFFPTFLDLADAEAPEGQKLDGVSLLPVFEGTQNLMERDRTILALPSLSGVLQQHEGTVERHTFQDQAGERNQER
jgi:arylsulfatase A-like enzyme